MGLRELNGGDNPGEVGGKPIQERLGLFRRWLRVRCWLKDRKRKPRNTVGVRGQVRTDLGTVLVTQRLQSQIQLPQRLRGQLPVLARAEPLSVDSLEASLLQLGWRYLDHYRAAAKEPSP